MIQSEKNIWLWLDVFFVETCKFNLTCKRLISPEYNFFLYFDRFFGEVAGLGIEDEFRENCSITW